MRDFEQPNNREYINHHNGGSDYSAGDYNPEWDFAKKEKTEEAPTSNTTTRLIRRCPK